MADISVIDGPVPVVVLIVGAIALVILLARRGRAALVTVAIAAGVALVTLLGLNWLLTRGLNLFPETLPTVVTLWISLGTAAVVLVVGNLVGTTVGRKVLAVGSGLAVLLAAGSQINVYFAEYPTLGALAGARRRRQPADRHRAAALGERRDAGRGPLDRPGDRHEPGPDGAHTRDRVRLHRPQRLRLPARGVLEPAGAAAPRPHPGVGTARRPAGLDRVRPAADPAGPVRRGERGPRPGHGRRRPQRPERHHHDVHGLRHRPADTYLSQDVPNWITSELGVDANHAHWAFGGFSYGGTCAIQMATRHTQLYPSFIDISGEREPAISADRTQTIQAAFGGDTAAFDALTPLTLLEPAPVPRRLGLLRRRRQRRGVPPRHDRGVRGRTEGGHDRAHPDGARAGALLGGARGRHPAGAGVARPPSRAHRASS